MPPKIFEFSTETGRPVSLSRKKAALFSIWFQRVFFFLSVISLIILAAGNILKKSKKWKAAKVSEKTAIHLKNNSSKDSSRAVSLPPLLVSLKGEEGIRMARINVNLQVSQPEVKREILSNNTVTHKRLLILLSGQESRDIRSKKSYFENRLLSWMNAFLSKGSVNKVTIQTTLLN